MTKSFMTIKHQIKINAIKTIIFQYKNINRHFKEKIKIIGYANTAHNVPAVYDVFS
jgi:hypothetical protein